MKIFLKIMATIIAVIVAVLIIFYTFGDEFIENKLKTVVSENTDGEYFLETADLRLSIFPLGIIASDLRVEPKDSLQSRPIWFSGTAVKPDLFASKLSVQGLSLFKFLFSDKINIKNVAMDSLVVNGRIQVKADSADCVLLGGKGDSKSKRQLQIGNIEIKSEGIYIFQETETVKNLMASLRLNTDIEDFSPSFKKTETDLVSKASLQLSDLLFYTADSLYKFELDSLGLDWETGSIRLHGFQQVPRLPKYEFALKKGKQTDRMDIVCHSVKTKGFDFPALSRGEEVNIKSVYIEGLKGEFYRDKRQPLGEEPVKPLPHESLLQVGVPVKIDSIIVLDSEIAYQEFNKDGSQEGEVAFKNLEATITNVNSNAAEHARLKATTMLFDEGRLQTEIFIPMNKDSLYTVRGTLGSMNLKAANKILKDVAFIEIQSGRLEEFNFHFTHNRTTSNGELNILYNNLEIAYTDQVKGDDKNIFDRIKAWAANNLVLDPANEKMKPVKGEVSFDRNMEKSIFNLWWKSLMSGLVDAVNPLNQFDTVNQEE